MIRGLRKLGKTSAKRGDSVVKNATGELSKTSFEEFPLKGTPECHL